ncbi:GntR family transcriptional regulator [Clostridium aminobutyricum]|uniref:GntR family transcriptional regulator n=1 Tax=Clostridium aminobutyricum TaxID=33953 RepID=A0A939DAS1_CLOAM|nr:GntR family transcriptional regulator [Clostridium aminobutyricum]MBN7774519.1 GntR family transcriptional regulator [Clostridium aminobutyricum]
MDTNFSNNGSLTDEIVDVLRDRILKGEYVIGEKLIENQIATEFKVSRTPIRDAFKLLEEEGLIDYIPNKGSFAKGFTRQDMEDIYAVRKALEQLAVEWAIERIGEKEVRELERQVELMEFYTKRKECEKVMEINVSFHELIYNATRSRFLAHILKSYRQYVQQARKATISEEENLEVVAIEHKEILKAIKAKDVDSAKDKIARHLDNSKNRAQVIWHIV